MYLQTLIMFSTYVQVRGRVGPAYKDSRGLDSQLSYIMPRKCFSIFSQQLLKLVIKKDLF